MKRKKLLSCLLYCILAILAFFLLLHQQGSMPLDKHMDTYFLQVFGGVRVDTTDTSVILSIFFYNIPWILFLYVFAPLFQKDFEVQYVYVFTRIGSKQKWLLQKTTQLFLQIFVSWGLLFAAAFAFGAGFGFALRGPALLYIQLFALQVLGIFTLSFAQNLLSIKMGITQSYIVTLCCYALAIMVGVLLYQNANVTGWLFPLLPTAGQMLLWHANAAVLPETLAVFFAGAAGFQVWKSIAVDLIYIVVLYVGTAFYLQKADLIDFIKEEN